jgi:hypothetical protein
LNPSGKSGRIDLVVRWARLALDEAAGDLPRGVGLLAVLDRQREERKRTLVLADGDRRDDHGLAELDDGGPGGLLRHSARLDDETAAGEDAFGALHVGVALGL